MASSKRVVVVDDEAAMRHMLTLLLEKQGYTVEAFENPLRALERIQQGGIDILLSDVRMPEMNGLDLLQAISDARLPVTTLMMSAYVDQDDAIEALKRGASDYVSKPFHPEEILIKIQLAEERLRLAEEKARLARENEELKGRLAAEVVQPSDMVGKSARMAEVFRTVSKVAAYKSTVLILGESGTGKELVARSLHDQSPRAQNPFIPINCGAIPENLLESELFGHVRGAFTDASRDKLGLIQTANHGTLFLDEIGELPLSLQVKLLRFLQEEEIRRVGDTKDIAVDTRVVAATARDLMEMVEEGSFREDLYYRLNVVQIHIPPLRERRDDVPLLVDHFVAKYRQRLGRGIEGFSRDALRVLLDYHWPGNVRELENTVERAMVLADGPVIDPESLPEKLTRAAPRAYSEFVGDDLSIKRASRAIERELIGRALTRTKGNRTRAAELLDISHRALLYKIKDYGLEDVR